MHEGPHLSPGIVLLAELVSGSGGAHLLHDLPPWLGGGLAALVVGIVLRVLDTPLRRISDRISGAPKPPAA